MSFSLTRRLALSSRQLPATARAFSISAIQRNEKLGEKTTSSGTGTTGVADKANKIAGDKLKSGIETLESVKDTVVGVFSDATAETVKTKDSMKSKAAQAAAESSKTTPEQTAEAQRVKAEADKKMDKV